jgi:hypothetical protein
MGSPAEKAVYLIGVTVQQMFQIHQVQQLAKDL